MKPESNALILKTILNKLNISTKDLYNESGKRYIQDVIFLLQTPRMSLGYGYNWGPGGPHSSDIIMTMGNMERLSPAQLEKPLKITNADLLEKEITRFNTAFGYSVHNPVFMNAAASLVYITIVMRTDYTSSVKHLLKTRMSLKNIPDIDSMLLSAYTSFNSFRNNKAKIIHD